MEPKNRDLFVELLKYMRAVKSANALQSLLFVLQFDPKYEVDDKILAENTVRQERGWNRNC